jgi:hypothetical protein
LYVLSETYGLRLYYHPEKSESKEADKMTEEINSILSSKPDDVRSIDRFTVNLHFSDTDNEDVLSRAKQVLLTSHTKELTSVNN